MLLRNALLASVLATSTASAAFAEWQVARTAHFTIYSEQPAAALKEYAERLERFDAAVRKVRGLEDPPLTDGSKVTIFVLPNAAAIQRLHSYTGTGVQGFYVGKASGSVAYVPSRVDYKLDIAADHVFQHEYTHHLQLSDQKTPLAKWMVEGMAEFFGTASIDPDGTVRIGAPPQSRGFVVTKDLGFSVEQLVTGTIAKDAAERESEYGKGWALTHLLAFSKPRAGQLTRYTAALSRGEPSLAAAKDAFGDLKVLDAELDRYVRGKFTGLRVPPGPQPQVIIRPLTAGEAAIMPVKMRIDRGVRKNEAGGVASDARAIAARFPDDAAVQEVLAKTEVAAKNYPAAIAAADRALALKPASVPAMIARGRALLAQAKDAKEAGKAADWAEARRWLIRANRADSENAEPLALYYQSFEDAGEKPSPMAIEGLLYAQTLAPQDLSVRVNAVKQLLADGKAAEAEPLFAPVAFNPHLPGPLLLKMGEVMTKIRARDARGALAQLDEEEKKQKEEADKKA